jgi:hypothetical protein
MILFRLSAPTTLVPQVAGVTDWATSMFNSASTVRFGPFGSVMNAMTTAVPKLVAGLTGGLFKADVARHW